MAVRLCKTSGNWLTGATWALVDSTSYNNSESTTTALTTAYQLSTTFTPGAITIDGIAVKLSVRTGVTGSITVALDQGGSDVAGTPVTINTADLPVAATADLNGGWIFFKFAAPVTLLAATLYSVKAKTSSSSQVSLFATATTNWARALRTTTTGAPAAGDDVIIAGEYTGAGTSNSFVVTMDETASTIYGSATTSLVTPAVAICSKGSLVYGTTASTNYNLKLAGCLVVYSGGTFTMGGIGTEIPRNSTATLLFNSAVNVDYGLTVRNLGTFNANGLSRTSGKDIYYCKLTADIAANATSLSGVDTDTGWLSGDEIAIASTTRTAADCEAGTLNGAAGASSLTVNGFAGTGGGVAVAHSGTSPTQAEVILLTRNVVIQGASASLQGYVDIKATATVACKWARFKWMGSATTNKRGIDVATTTGSCSFTYCSLTNFEVASSGGLTCSSASGSGITFSNNVTWRIDSAHLQMGATSGTWTADSNIFMRVLGAAAGCVILSDVGGVFTNNTVVGGSSGGNAVSLGESAGLGTYSGNTVHSCGTIGWSCGAMCFGTISTLTIWRCGGSGIGATSGAGGDVTYSTVTLFGNTTANISASGARQVFANATLNGDSSFSTTNGVFFNSTSSSEMIFLASNLGTASGIKTAHTNDLSCSSSFLPRCTCISTILASATEVANQTFMPPSGFIASQKHDQTAGLHKMWKRYGNLAIETTTVHTGSQSLKMTPNNTSFKLETQSFFVAVASGQTVTPSVYIYKDASYNGNQPRLMLRRNDAVGITSDTVIATYSASTGSWNAISAATASASDDGVMEFFIDCDGTAGNVFVDSFTAT